MKKHLLFAITLFVLAITIGACKKDDSCTAVVTVKNEDGIAQPGYMVVFGNHRGAQGATSTNYNTQQVTDSKGRVSVTYKLEAIIEARAYAPGETDFSQANEDGWTSVNLEPGETVNYTIVVE